ncbi:universal stress protein [Planosporangium mesophilum]|uniref:universal stress protein n=1 Tax=Planosporangium mesophilum TaxID=689768 RepID=UPI001438CA5F|nr:universal stress protein [Planosporangium mesophilum]NJC85949.1 universal stress protein [Planosporangium mesophilum]
MGSGSRPVVVGVDDSAAGLAAARLAAAEAVLHRRSLRLLAADPEPAVGAIRDDHPALPIERETVPGDLADALVERSRAAHLVVVATGAAGIGSSPQVADPIGVRVAAHAGCPVIIDPAGRAALTGPVLLGIDEEAEEPTVVEYAFAEALVRGVPLCGVHIWAGLPGEALSTLDPFAYDARAADDDVDRLLAEALAGWASRYPDVPVQRRAVHNPNTAHAMIELSTDAALMVVSARRHAGLSGMLLGSVTGALIGRARCPLAIVPARCVWPG